MSDTVQKPGHISPITEIRAVQGYGHVAESLLFLDPAQAKQAQGHLAQWMADQQLTGTFDVLENRPVLRIRTTAPDGLRTQLNQAGLISDKTMIPAAQPVETPSLTERLKRNTIRLAGALYMLGNAFVTIGGIKRLEHAKLTATPAELKGAKAELFTGLAFNAGDLIMLAFGHKTPEQQLDKVSRALGTLADQQGWQIPDASPIRLAQARNDSTTEKVGNFMRENVIAFKSVAEVTAGASFAVAGLRQENMKKAASGALIALGFGLGQLIPERKPAHFRDQVAHGPRDDSLWGKFRHWVEEKPMRVMGAMTLTNNVLTTMGAMEERKGPSGNLGFWKYNIGQAASFASANMVLASSSKTNTQTTETLMDQAYAMAANIALQLPPGQRPQAIETMAACLSRLPEIDATFTEARGALQQRVNQQATLLLDSPLMLSPRPEPAVELPKPNFSFAERVGGPKNLGEVGDQNQGPKRNTVPGEWRETVRRQEADQATNHHERS